MWKNVWRKFSAFYLPSRSIDLRINSVQVQMNSMPHVFHGITLLFSRSGRKWRAEVTSVNPRGAAVHMGEKQGDPWFIGTIWPGSGDPKNKAPFPPRLNQPCHLISRTLFVAATVSPFSSPNSYPLLLWLMSRPDIDLPPPQCPILITNLWPHLLDQY